RVDRAELEATREAAFVAVEARDVPSLLAQGEGDRPADQPDADHRRTTAQFAHGRSVEGVIVGDVTGESRRRPTALPRRRSWWRWAPRGCGPLPGRAAATGPARAAGRRARRCACGRAARRDGRRPRTCAGPGGCGPRGS